MKASRATALALIGALGAGFAVGRFTAPRIDPELAGVASFRWSLEDPDWLDRTWRMGAFLQGLTPENLPASLEVLGPRIPWLVTDELRLFMFAWARFDPAGALRQALAWPAPFDRNAAGAAIYAWAFLDPQAALAALEAVEDDGLRDFMERRLVAGWVHGPQKQSASEWIAALPAGSRRFEYVGKLAWELAKDGPEALVRWAEEIPARDARFKASVFLQATSTLAPLDPASTAAWLAPHLDRDYADGVMRTVARIWVGRDPEAAMAWLAALPVGSQRADSVSHAFSAWLEASPEEATAWLRSAAPAAALDPAVRAIVGRTRRDDPAGAMDWALALDDPERRRTLVASVGRAWMRRDPGAARAWLERHELDPATRQAILAPGPQDPERGAAGEDGGSASPDPVSP